MEGTLTVVELSELIRRTLAQVFPDEVWVEGELANLSRSAAGHVYFQLIEPGDLARGPRASVAVTLFDTNRKAVNAMLKRSGGVRMEDGMRIRIRGSLDWYGPQGRLQLKMTGIDPLFTLGRLAAERDRVLAALRDEGILTDNRRRSLAAVPLRVGLVTAPDSAAYHDFVDELAASGFAFHVRHVAVSVQGRAASPSVTAALVALAADALDVVAIVRGGGARTDLAAFDSEGIARAIAAHPSPVFTGIGHETDVSVADLVAHTAHKTPTACAAALVATVGDFLAGLTTASALVAERARVTLVRADEEVRVHGAGIPAAARRVLLHRSDARRRAASRLGRSTGNTLHRASLELDRREHAVALLDPAHLLRRGWTITRSVDGRPLRSVAELDAGAELLTTFADGEARSVVVPGPPPDGGDR